jgi:hypothetical protein
MYIPHMILLGNYIKNYEIYRTCSTTGEDDYRDGILVTELSFPFEHENPTGEMYVCIYSICPYVVFCR